MLACTCICAPCAHLLPEDKPKECITFSETKVTDGWKLPCLCWEPNPDPLQKQQLLLPLNCISCPMENIFIHKKLEGNHTAIHKNLFTIYILVR